jgi:hypothetical protein
MPEFLPRLRYFFLNSVVQSSVLTLISLWFFLAIGFPTIFNKLPIFQQKWFGIATLIFYSIACILFVLPKEISRSQKWYTAINSVVFMTFSALYFIRVNNSPFELLTLNLSTKLHSPQYPEKITFCPCWPSCTIFTHNIFSCLLF